MDDGNLWWLLVLLAGQFMLSLARATLHRARRETNEERIGMLPNITHLSIALDFAHLLMLGGYFILGARYGHPVLLHVFSTPLEPSPVWLAPITYGVLLLLLAWVSLSVGWLAPEAIGYELAQPTAERITRLAQFISGLLKPFTLTALALGNAISRWLGGASLQRFALITEEEIKTLVIAGEHEGVIEEGEREMIYSIFRLGDMITREIMIPRIDLVAFDVDTPIHETLEVIVASGHSRIPIYADTIDNIIGVLYVKDLIPYRSRGDALPTLRDILRPTYFVPESKRLDTLLREMQEAKIQLAIVVDEYGGVSGMVTLEDIVEEIVGEIQDEYDREEPEVTALEAGGYLFDARIPLDDVQEILDIPLPLEEADSLGGFVYNQLGHIPTAKEQLTFDGIVFEVAEITGRRIRKVKATKITTPEEAMET